MSNSLLNISMITKEALRELKNQLGFAKNVNRQYDSQFAKSGAKIGSTINIRKPVRFSVTDGAAMSLQNVADQSDSLTLDQQKHVAFQFSSKDMTLSVDEFRARYIAPAITALANKIDFDGLSQYKYVYNAAGTPNTVPQAIATILAAGRKLDDSGCPVDGDRHLVVNPACQASMIDKLSGLFQSSEKIKEQYEKGRMGLALGFNWKMDQNVNVHTCGTQGGTPLVDGAQTGAAGSILLKGWTSAVATRLNLGDVITFDGVYGVNPVSGQSTGALMQFVVTEDMASTSGGAGTVKFAPFMVASGAYKNVSATPAGDAALTVLGASAVVSPVNMAYHKDAFVLGMADLDLPSGVDMAARASDPESGLSVRIVKAYDINNDTFPCRIDVLYGWKTIRPELACRLHG
jgi:hypothetical protein